MGAANASIFTGARVIHVSSQHGHAPKILEHIHQKTNTPIYALILQSSLSLIFVLSASFTGLVTFYCIIAWSFFFLAVLGLLILRHREPVLLRPFRVWLAIPVIFCLSCLFLITLSVFEEPIIALYSFLFMVSGVPVWWLVVYHEISWEGKNHTLLAVN